MDDGSSENFMHPALTQYLEMVVHQEPQFKVQVGSGQLLQCEGEVINVLVTI